MLPLLSLALSLLELQAAANAEKIPDEARRECGGPAENEVVVCGSRPRRSPYRMPQLAEEKETGLGRAETEIAPGVRTSVDVDSVDLPGGARSDRVKLTIKLKF